MYCTPHAASSSISFRYMPYDREKQKKREGPWMVFSKQSKEGRWERFERSYL